MEYYRVVQRSKMPLHMSIAAAWKELVDHIREYFYDPDLGALEIALSACVSFYHKGADPVWLFVLGPSGGDKTSVIVNCSLGMSASHLMGDLTTKTFLSGYTGKANASLLHQIGSGILVFKDFTTFISKRLEDQSVIASQLREIYDGEFKRDTGMGDPVMWHGKISVIAAGTPALERKWGILGDLGERFVQVRLPRKDGLKQAAAAQRQAGKEEYISTRMRQLAVTLMQTAPAITYPPPVLSQAQSDMISAMAELLAHGRGKVTRTYKGIMTGQVDIENSSRASKELNSLVSGHASLFRRTEIDNIEDMWVAQRVARNSIPINRYLILSELATYAGHSYTVSDLQRVLSLPLSTVKNDLEELEALHMIIQEESMGADTVRLTPVIKELWETGLAKLGQGPVQPQSEPPRQPEPQVAQPEPEPEPEE